jgi:dTMP kinase
MLDDYPWVDELWGASAHSGQPGLFVAVEGPHGSGKSTTVDALVALLSARAADHVATKEPTPTELGEFVRSASEWIRGPALAALIAADRWFHLGTVIIPALGRGTTVISDRYTPSSLVLQTLDCVPLAYIVAVNRGMPAPALTVFLDCRVEILAERRSRRRGSTRFERDGNIAEEAALYQTVARGVRRHSPDQAMVFDSSAEAPDQIAQAVIARLDTLGSGGGPVG